MTIATHCLDLLSRRSPQSPEELAEACVAAGVTRSRTPVASVTQAMWGQRFLAPPLSDGRFGYTPHLLDGRWFTTRRWSGNRVPASFDIGRLPEVLGEDGLPSATAGGRVRATSHADGLQGPPGWLPPEQDDALLAVRLHGGVVEVRTTPPPDERALRAGEDLATRIRKRVRRPQRDSGEWVEKEVWAALLQLLGDDPDVLREPVAPLSELLPEYVHRPAAKLTPSDPIIVVLPQDLSDNLVEQAKFIGRPLDEWLTDQLEDLARKSPARTYCEPYYDQPYYESWR
jgi:hypothetical protein